MSTNKNSTNKTTSTDAKILKSITSGLSRASYSTILGPNASKKKGSLVLNGSDRIFLQLLYNRGVAYEILEQCCEHLSKAVERSKKTENIEEKIKHLVSSSNQKALNTLYFGIKEIKKYLEEHKKYTKKIKVEILNLEKEEK